MHNLLARVLVLAFPCSAIAQVAILQIKIVEGEAAVHAPGSRVARPLVVEVTEESGRPVAGAPVSFHLPEDGPGGLFLNGLLTDVVLTDAKGRAGLPSMRVNRISGPFQIRITVAKDQARAGTISQQYVAELTSGSPRAAKAGGKSATKWIVLAAVAAAAAGGAVAGVSRGSNRAPQTPAPPPPPSIGPPTITIGRP